jgi:hypothetical protein
MSALDSPFNVKMRWLIFVNTQALNIGFINLEDSLQIANNGDLNGKANS